MMKDEWILRDWGVLVTVTDRLMDGPTDICDCRVASATEKEEN